MDQVLQTMTGAQMMSMLDGFFGYNQIELRESYQHKIAFTTPWGTFSYCRMPFGLINAGDTFQRAMDLAFHGVLGRYIVVYLDDLTIFSKDRVFFTCKMYWKGVASTTFLLILRNQSLE